MPAALKKCIISIVFPVKEWEENGWNEKKIGDWIRNAQGKLEKFDLSKTTHLIVGERDWRSKRPAVHAALTSNKIRVLMPEWLESVLRDSRKPENEKEFLWKEVDKKGASRSTTVKYLTEATGGSSAKGAPARTVEVLINNTNQFVDERTKKKNAKLAEEMRQAKKDAEEAQKKEIALQKSKKIETFEVKRKALFERSFKDNNHIYADETGFKYDIKLTKSDNKNGLTYIKTLEIHESNDELPTYTVNLQSAGTKLLPNRHLLTGMGSNFPTAWRKFTMEFREITGIAWDDRIEGYEALRKSSAEKFHVKKFTYRPPQYDQFNESGAVAEDVIDVDALSVSESESASEDEERRGPRSPASVREQKHLPQVKTESQRGMKTEASSEFGNGSGIDGDQSGMDSPVSLKHEGSETDGVRSPRHFEGAVEPDQFGMETNFSNFGSSTLGKRKGKSEDVEEPKRRKQGTANTY